MYFSWLYLKIGYHKFTRLSSPSPLKLSLWRIRRIPHWTNPMSSQAMQDFGGPRGYLYTSQCHLVSIHGPFRFGVQVEPNSYSCHPRITKCYKSQLFTCTIFRYIQYSQSYKYLLSLLNWHTSI